MSRYCYCYCHPHCPSRAQPPSPSFTESPQPSLHPEPLLDQQLADFVYPYRAPATTHSEGRAPGSIHVIRSALYA